MDDFFMNVQRGAARGAEGPGSGQSAEEPAPAPPPQGIEWGKEAFKGAIASGNISTLLQKAGGWTTYLQDILSALEQVTERARISFQSEAVGEAAPQQMLTANPAMMVGLLKTSEFQQVLAVMLVQFLKVPE